MSSAHKKPVPGTILIFGAAGHMGGPLAELLTREAPQIKLRLVSRNGERAGALRAQFPDAQVVQADYLDLPSLVAAAEGVEGVFVTCPAGTDESIAMTNLVKAFRQVGANPHIIRQLGMQPEFSPSLIPDWIKQDGRGIPIQHPIAKRILDESGFPVTYVNTLATFIDNFAKYMLKSLRSDRQLIWPPRTILYIDTAEVGEFVGRLFLSEDARQYGQFHTINNGQDLLSYDDVVQIMSEVFGETVTYDPSREAYFREYAPMGEETLTYLWNLFEYDSRYEVGWARNDLLERYLGRRPKTVREWLIENKSTFDRI
ncbi:MAG TPA: NmrA family NAD(P)-binding protein [Sphingobium sp.]|nr:NmrA family NAD(P)-binding protein [Sphingobium sp.]